MLKKLLIIFFVLYLNAPSPVISEEVPDSSPLQRGKFYFYSKDYGKAYDAFHEAFLENPTNLNISFFLGRAAFENKDYESAFMAFDRILIMEPQAVRVKLEIARCHMELGAYEAAKQYFYEVLETNPPASVRNNIDFFMAVIASAQKRNFINGMLSVGYSYDDNVRSTTFAPVLSNGLTVPEDLLKESIYTSNFVLNHIFKFEDQRVAWKSSLIAAKTTNTEAKDLDILLTGITTGPMMQINDFLCEFHGSFNNVSLAYNDYLQQAGIGSSISFLYSPIFNIALSTGLEKKKYSLPSSSAIKDATNYFLTLSPNLTLSEKDRIALALTKERENATNNYYSYDGLKWSLRFDHFFSQNFAFYCGTSLNSKNYEEHDPALLNITTIRQDKVLTHDIGFSLNLWRSKDKKRNVSLQVSHTYTDASSNIVDYAYSKNVTTGIVAYTF